MSRDPIERWLREVDEAAARPAMPVDLPARVRQRVQRRRRRRQIGTGAGAGLALVLAVVLIRPYIATPPAETIVKVPVPPPAAPDSQADLEAELQLAMGNLRSRALAELKQLSRVAEARAATLGVLSPAEAVDQQLEQAAQLIVYQAERLQNELNLPAEAIHSYQRAVKLFPTTRAAGTARARLNELNASRGDRT